ncbi:MAG: transcriptional regulator [Geobacteraceae bacterium GWC2_58_44]|nr:MAG: transcriptional regulator [Geobacteraceae bacterium GWC2_58_44]HBG08018.1 transcriptional regulator [Geobacter sp.]
MKKTYEIVEKALIDGLLKGDPKPGTQLQSERDLAARFAVSRATVREALLKLQKSGWISVQQRHATIVNDFWSRGDLEILSSISRNSEPFPPDLASHLLELRVQFAPDYARRAVENGAAQLTECLNRFNKLRNSLGAMVKFDWELHLTMAVLSGNKIYPLIMNSFASLYTRFKEQFFANEEHRAQARSFYRDLLQAASTGNAAHAEDVTRAAMQLRLEEFKRQSDLPAPKKKSLKERFIRR